MSYKHLLVAIDLSEPSDKVIARAVSMAKNLDAKISFINVDVSHLDADMVDYDIDEKKLIKKTHDVLVDEFKQIVDVIEYPIENTLVVEGDFEEKLVDAVKELDIDLVVSGHHHGFWHRWWSSAHKLVNITTVDLLLITI